jgi:hypothetical protein
MYACFRIFSEDQDTKQKAPVAPHFTSLHQVSFSHSTPLSSSARSKSSLYHVQDFTLLMIMGGGTRWYQEFTGHRVRYSQPWESDCTHCFFKYMYKGEELNA